MGRATTVILRGFSEELVMPLRGTHPDEKSAVPGYAGRGTRPRTKVVRLWCFEPEEEFDPDIVTNPSLSPPVSGSTQGKLFCSSGSTGFGCVGSQEPSPSGTVSPPTRQVSGVRGDSMLSPNLFFRASQCDGISEPERRGKVFAPRSATASSIGARGLAPATRRPGAVLFLLNRYSICSVDGTSHPGTATHH